MAGIDEFVHRFEAARDPARPVILALHGTGGDERDLVPLARASDGAAGVLSPRGQVLEQGMPRFFRRLAEGVFDQEDLRVGRRRGDDAVYPGGHGLSPQEVRDAAAWFRRGSEARRKCARRRRRRRGRTAPGRR